MRPDADPFTIGNAGAVATGEDVAGTEALAEISYDTDTICCFVYYLLV